MLVARLLPLLLLVPSVRSQDGGRDPARIIGETVERQLRMEVETRLRSDRPETVAWGAWLASRHRVRSAIPALRRALAELDPAGAGKHAAQAILDALIETGAKVEARELRQFHRGMHEAAAFVLLSRDVRKNADFFRQRFVRFDRQGRYSRWLAAGNLLAKAKDREFGRYLLAGMNMQVQLRVYDGDSIGGGAGGAVGGKHVDRGFQVPARFPPAVTYRTVRKPRVGDVLFAAGKLPIYYRREVHEGGKVPNGPGEQIVLDGRQRRRAEWIAQAAGRFVPDVPVRKVEYHAWRGVEAFEKEVAQQRKNLAWRQQQVEAAVTELGWIEASERERFRLRVDLVVHDVREDRKVALPAIE